MALYLWQGDNCGRKIKPEREQEVPLGKIVGERQQQLTPGPVMSCNDPGGDVNYTHPQMCSSLETIGCLTTLVAHHTDGTVIPPVPTVTSRRYPYPKDIPRTSRGRGGKNNNGVSPEPGSVPDICRLGNPEGRVHASSWDFV